MRGQYALSVADECGERWLPTIKEFENTHQISDHGRVKALERIGSDGRKLREKIMKPRWAGSSGQRLSVTLIGNGETRRAYVHVLVLENFVGPRPPGLKGLHADDNGENNVLTNLSWGTDSQNNYDLVKNGRHANARKTQCPQGHNLVMRWKNGGRRCIECEQDRTARRKNARHAAKALAVCGHRG